MEIPNICDPSHKKNSHHNQDHSKKSNIERYFEVKNGFCSAWQQSVASQELTVSAWGAAGV